MDNQDTKSVTLNLYLLERIDVMISGERSKCIVAGTDESKARQIANEDSGAEGYVWTDGHGVNAKRIGIADDGIQGVVCWSVE